MADRDKFSLFDADGDGCITVAELPLVLYAHGCNPTVKEAEALAARCPDPNRIDFNTFASILGQRRAPHADALAATDQCHQSHTLERTMQPLAGGHMPPHSILPAPGTAGLASESPMTGSDACLPCARSMGAAGC